MEDNISKIKERLDVVEVLSGYIKVQKAGMNYKARCPFHNEKTPSFYISPERQIWHCFGCQKGGDIFGFVKEIEGIEFPDALRILAQKAGIQLQHHELISNKDEKSVLFEISELATKFFEKQLRASRTGMQALKYLKERGLEEKIIDEFRLGFAANDWEALSRFLKDRGFGENDIVGAGLAIKREGKPGIYDRFRSRIMFPIMDLNGRVVGFTGRVFEAEKPLATKGEQPAKYINTPQTLIYDKSMVLYGLSKAKQAIRQNDKCLLVEGNMDALMSYQAGVANVVASSGTALTPNHLKILQRYTNNLDLSFDTDQAGTIATRKGIGLALAQNFNVKVVTIDDPSCKDPADYVQKYGPKWGDLVSASKPVIQSYFDKIRSQIDPASVEGKKLVVSTLAPFIQRLVSKVERTHWLTELAVYLRTKEESLEADINAAKDDLGVYGIGSSRVTTPAVTTSPIVDDNLSVDILSEALLSIVIKNPVLFKDEIGIVDMKSLDFRVASVISKLTELGLDNFDFASFVNKFDGEEALKLEFAYLRSQELWKEFSNKELSIEFANINKRIRQRSIIARLTNLEYEIREAESEKDKSKILDLINRFTNLTKELTDINNV
jgi:DNA primase